MGVCVMLFTLQQRTREEMKITQSKGRHRHGESEPKRGPCRNENFCSEQWAVNEKRFTLVQALLHIAWRAENESSLV